MRTWCEVLDEMRALHKTRNFASFLGLIEELQIYGNRMESGLNDKKTVTRWSEKRSKLKKEIKELESKARKLAKKTKTKREDEQLYDY